MLKRLVVLSSLLIFPISASAGTVTAVYYNAAGEVTMVVIPDHDSQLTDKANAAAFSPKNQTRVLMLNDTYNTAKSERDLKEISAEILSKGTTAEAELAEKLEVSVLNGKSAEAAMKIADAAEMEVAGVADAAELEVSP